MVAGSCFVCILENFHALLARLPLPSGKFWETSQGRDSSHHSTMCYVFALLLLLPAWQDSVCMAILGMMPFPCIRQCTKLLPRLGRTSLGVRVGQKSWCLRRWEYPCRPLLFINSTYCSRNSLRAGVTRLTLARRTVRPWIAELAPLPSRNERTLAAAAWGKERSFYDESGNAHHIRVQFAAGTLYKG